MANEPEPSRHKLREIFESQAVYADRWSAEVRAALDVPDGLTSRIVKALQDGQSVLISGNAGDGKSHLAQVALDQVVPRRCIEVTKAHPIREIPSADQIVFVRDASGLSDKEILSTVARARAAGAPLLITINEGPLASLAEHQDGDLFRVARDILHARAIGMMQNDPPELLLVSLAGRQLTRSNFVPGVLEKLLPLVTACPSCGKSSSCPRVVGAKMLRRSRAARERLQLLLRLLTDGGTHLSARDIWVFLIDLFFGWVCPGDGEERSEGYFWNRIFDGESTTARRIRSNFDPVAVPLAREDVYLWRGRFTELRMDCEYPGSAPVALARESSDAGLAAFASAKRCYYFFGKAVQAEKMMAGQSRAPHFGRLLAASLNDQRPVIRDLVGYINRYRLGLDTQNDLYVSRHNGFAAHRRPWGLGAYGKLPIERLEILVPYRYENETYGEGFFPTRVYLHWAGSQQFLTVDFETWERLQEKRTLTVDRDQETLDFALDLFMAQADIPAIDDPEVIVFDHRRREQTRLRVRASERVIEVLQ
ncbi:hypothetical protein [Micromonospora sp. MA102]|uniref:hypothetical protein n=1 Tax=Micromonospora sp. MA102 TaxID=2952755 RepID=UPI0021C9DF19|nr:hypothetical protein [Micromonospora sp. MA102]